MEQPNEFIPGDTVPESIDELAELMPWADFDDLREPENPILRILAQKGSAAKSRIYTFFGRHEWRRDENSAQKGREWKDDKKPVRPIYQSDDILTDPTRDESTEGEYWGTNRILDYFGFLEGGERNDFLKGFSGDHHYGANIVRTAFHLAKANGLVDNSSGIFRKRKEIFRSIANSIHRDYSPLLIGYTESLVPTKDLDRIVFEKGTLPLKSQIGPSLMSDLGYEAVHVQIEGVPTLYFRPTMMKQI